MAGMTDMPKTYDPSQAESHWYARWEAEGLFEPRAKTEKAENHYTIVSPPPNVTGSLHMGHACRVTFEDVLIRYHRMRGDTALWIPGTDHAGIATQVVVERQLQREGKSRHDLGRDAFIERVWAWRDQSGGRILHQMRQLGASCAWNYHRFTMDEGPSRAVREVFVRLYEEGLIYRGTRLVNWDVQAQTVLSDLEVENQEQVQGELFDFAYRLVDSDDEVVVSTTRPETILGDTALAVHPDDERYRHLHGTEAQHPFLDRRIPIITDAELVDPEFGTGVVKVTPAHDFNDFATGKRHDLEEINILNLDGTLNENAGEFTGMDRFVARKAVKAKLETMGLARGSRKHRMTLPRSQRSGTIVEPLISTQWFVSTKPLAEPAIRAVEEGRIQILPEDWSKTYFHWMRNIQDWCISRQLWWGHSIPAWYCNDCGTMRVARSAPTECEACGSVSLRQDEDVLDTWFSSALWPFSTLGWPDKTEDLKRFYPTSDLETGYDILFFWVARMIMMGLHFMDDVPFRRVLLAGLVTDERGEKMSKVKGNVVDPLDVVHGATLESLIVQAERAGAKEQGLNYLRKTYPEGFAPYGADALRMTLLSYSPQSRRIALSIKRIEGYRNFSNKLWNAARYGLMKLERRSAFAKNHIDAPQHLANQWILSRLHAVIGQVHHSMQAYRLDDAALGTYHFVWDEVCDWYLEISKALLELDDTAVVRETEATLVHVLEVVMRLLHPMMPFITEDIWQRIPKQGDWVSDYLVTAPFPAADEVAFVNAEAEQCMAAVQECIRAVRGVRAEYELARSTVVEVDICASDADELRELMAQAPLIQSLAGCALKTVEASDMRLESSPRYARAAALSFGTIEARVCDVIDPIKERERLQRELSKLEKDLQVVSRKLANQGFVARAPKEVVDAEHKRHATLSAKKTQLEEAAAKLA